MAQSKFGQLLEQQGISANDVNKMSIYIKGTIKFAKTKTYAIDHEMNSNKEKPVYKVSMTNFSLVPSSSVLPDSRQNPQLEQAIYNALIQTGKVSTDPKTGIQYLYATKDLKSAAGKNLPPFVIIDNTTKASYWATNLDGDLGEQEVISMWNVSSYTQMGGGFNIYPNGFIVPDINNVVYYDGASVVPNGFTAPEGQYQSPLAGASNNQAQGGQMPNNNQMQGNVQGNANGFNNNGFGSQENQSQNGFNNNFTQGGQMPNNNQMQGNVQGNTNGFNNEFTQSNDAPNNDGFDPSFEDDGSAF